MTLFTFNLTRNTVADDLDRLIAKITNPGPRQRKSISDAIRQRFQENFTRQGSGAGPWAALRPVTVAQRIALGYPGQRPILVRSGRYRASFVQRGAPGHYESIQSGGGRLIIDVGSDDERAEELELGTANMAARPVTILDGTQEARLFDVIEFMIGQIENETVGR